MIFFSCRRFKNAKALVALFVCAFLSGCGFHPLYSTEKEGNVSTLGSITVATIANRDGQYLRNKLMTLLTPYGAPSQPRYTLAITLANTLQNLGILKDATASQIQVNYTATVVLSDRQTHRTLLTTKSEATTNYNTISVNPFSTVAESQFAQTKAMENLAYDIRNQLAAYFLLKDKATEGTLKEKKDAQGMLKEIFDPQKISQLDPPQS